MDLMNVCVGLIEKVKKSQAESITRMKDIKPKSTLVRLQDPIRTGMALAFGFFLMTIVLTIVGWIFIGASCAAIMNGF